MKKLLRYSFIILLLAYLTVMICWANHQASNEICKKVDVDILNDDEGMVFLTKDGILKELSDAHINPIGRPTYSINTDSIERLLNKFDYLEDAECVIRNNNQLVIQVSQMVPVMRVFDGNNSYYLNKEGKVMKADARYHLDVPIVRGHFYNTAQAAKLIPLAQYISADPTINSFVTGIDYKGPNNIFIVPNIHGHVVNIGNISNLDGKFEKLFKFYQEVMPVKGWYTYDTIAVKWDHQIVATRRIKEAKSMGDFGPEDDEDTPDLGTMLVSDSPEGVASAEQGNSGNSLNKRIKKEAPEKKETEKEKAKAPEKKETEHRNDRKSEKVTKEKEKEKSKKKEAPETKSKKEKEKDSKNASKKSASKSDKKKADEVTKKAFAKHSSSNHQKKEN